MRFSWGIALMLSAAVGLPLACGSNPSPFDEISGASAQCKYQVYRHDENSWLLTDPEIFMDFWGDWSSQDAHDMQSNIMNDWYYLLNEDRVLARLSEYGIHEGNFQYFLYQDNPYPIAAYTITNDAGYEDASVDGGDAGPDIISTSVLDDSKFPIQLQKEIQLGLIPYPNDNTLYVVQLPPGSTTVAMKTNGWDGYHNNSSYDGQRFAYAIISYGSKQSIDVITSHEIYEACTNPGDGSGYWDDNSGDEVADICEGNNVGIDGYTVQAVWSQVLCTCQ